MVKEKKPPDKAEGDDYSDVVEAVIGAIYLDGGLDDASNFIHRVVLSDLETSSCFMTVRHYCRNMYREKAVPRYLMS